MTLATSFNHLIAQQPNPNRNHHQPLLKGSEVSTGPIILYTIAETPLTTIFPATKHWNPSSSGQETTLPFSSIKRQTSTNFEFFSSASIKTVQTPNFLNLYSYVPVQNYKKKQSLYEIISTLTAFLYQKAGSFIRSSIVPSHFRH